MKILFIGDIFASSGRRAVRELLPELREEFNADVVLANCENAAAGAGLTRKTYEELISMGIDFMTSGNHIWNRHDVYSFIDSKETKLIRPANYPEGTPGRGSSFSERLKASDAIPRRSRSSTTYGRSFPGQASVPSTGTWGYWWTRGG